MFSITFTKAQAEQFIHGIFQKNFRDNPEFIVRISDEYAEDGDMEIKGYIKELSSGSALKVETATEQQVNPWLVPDSDGWFTHDPDWNYERAPSYIKEAKRIAVILRDDSYSQSNDDCSDYAKFWNWCVDGGPSDIIKWKYIKTKG